MLKRALFLLLIAALMGLSILSPSQPIRSAGAEGDTPPVVTDIWPEPGVELLANDVLTISFDQPMDAASVEAAFSLDPALVGKFSWDDGQTLNFKPGTSWPREQTFTLKIAKSAAAANGLKLVADYTAALKTLGPLQVASVNPQPNADEASIASRIVISFNRPVVALAASSDTANKPEPLALEITPDVAGTGEWVNTSLYTFTPNKPLKMNTQYSVHVPARITSADGAIMSKAYDWSFYTTPPGVIGADFTASNQSNSKYDPKSVALDPEILIAFDQKMDHPSAEAAFSLTLASGGDKLDGYFRWFSPSSKAETLIFKPKALLVVDTDYVVTITKTAKAAGDLGALRKDKTFKFHTQQLPTIKSSWPKDGAKNVNIYWGIEFEFNVPMDVSTVLPRVSISPEVKGMRIGTYSKGTTVYIEMPSAAPNTTYTVTLRSGARDTYGNAMLSSSSFSFTTARINAYAERGPIQTDYEPIINGDFMITSANRKNTAVGVAYFQGLHAIPMGLYRMSPSEIGPIEWENHQWYYSLEYGSANPAYFMGSTCQSPAAVRPENLMRSWTFDPTNNPGDNNLPQVNLASEKGGKLTPGMYWITMGTTTTCVDTTSTDQQKPNAVEGPERQFGLAVVNTNITLKRGSDDVFVWVTDLDNAAPIPNAAVTLYGSDGKAIANGKTDDKGAVRLPIRVLETRFFLVTAEAPGIYGAWYNHWQQGTRILKGDPYDNATQTEYVIDPADRVGNVYTDRPVYRPGDTVYFRGILRNKRDLSYPVPTTRTAYLTIGKAEVYDWGYTYIKSEDKLYETKITLTEYGTFSGEYKLPDDAQTRFVYIQVGLEPQQVTSWGDVIVDEDAMITATISAYRPVEFQVSVKPEKPYYFAGDTIKATLTGQYYSGNLLSGAQVDWKISTSESTFAYTGTEDYYFGSSDYYGGYSRMELASGTATADAKGQVQISTNKKPAMNDRIIPLQVTIEGTYQDESGIQSVGRATTLFYPSNLFFGTRERTNYRRVRQPVQYSILMVDADSQPLANHPFNVQVYLSSSYNNVASGTLVTENLVTDAEGKAEYSFTPPYRGSYKVTFTAVDEKGRNASTVRSFYLWSQSDQSDNPEPAMNMTVARNSLHAGDNIDLTMTGPFDAPGRLLITVERAGVLTYDVVDPKGQDTVKYTLKTLDSYAPNVFVTATYLPGLNGGSTVPNILYAGVSLDVDLVKPLLSVEITPSKRQAKPGETVTFDVRVTDSDGKPVVGEVGFALVDKAILALAAPNDTPLRTTFFSSQSKMLFTDFSVDGLIEALTDRRQREDSGGRGGGEGGSEPEKPVDVRRDFKVTPLWSPNIITNADGRASVTVKLPDNLTTWRLDVRVVTQGNDIHIGQAQTEISTNLPLSIRPVAPRFFVVGDRVTLAAAILNGTETDQTVRAKLEAKGVSIDGDAEKSVTIAAGARARVTWSVVVERGQSVDLTFYAIGQNGAQDAAKPLLTTGPDGTIPVLTYTTPDVPASTSGILQAGGSLSEIVAIPHRLQGLDGNLTLRVEPSLAAALPDSFKYLRQYPYYCIEQTTSTFLPNIFTYRALRDIGKSDPTLEKGLNENMQAALKKIAGAQNKDGGWGWYAGWDSHLLITTYVVLSLTEAQNAGLSIAPLNQSSIDQGIGYMKANMIAAGTTTDMWRLNRQAFLLYVLARAGKVEINDLQTLFDARSRLSVAGRAYLLMAFAEEDPKNAAIKSLTDDLVSKAKLTATGASWEEDYMDWWNWGSDIRSTALAVSALLRSAPDNPLLPNAIRWLMAARQGDHWSTTQETVWSLNALTGWMLKTGELDSQYSYSVILGKNTLARGDITPETLRQAAVVSIPVRDLTAGKGNRLTFTRGDGRGALYYTARLNLEIPAKDAKAAGRGFTLYRQYFSALTGKPITSARVGDTVNVRLTLNVLQDVQYVVLQDFLPAGLEPVDSLLLNTASDESNYNPYDDYYWFWGWWWFGEKELRDTGAAYYAENLWSGTYVLTYQAKAVSEGTFQTIPARVNTFYLNDLYGRTNGLIFTVLPPK